MTRIAPFLPSLVVLLAFAVAVGSRPRSSPAADWPSYQHDNARSASTAEKLATPLAEQWAHRSRSRPRTAWPGPAKWDGWRKLYGLKDRMLFDRAFHVVATHEAVYFGSSADDKIYCLDAATGEERWVYYTEGPIRLAPTLDGGNVYAGSDDGHLYCLRASDGELRWRRRIGPRDKRLPGNGRIISLWPVRSGIVVDDDRVFCAAGVVPWERVYLAALKADSGEEVWKTSFNDVPAQGYMLASATKLYVTTARDRPVVFDRETGKRLYQVEGGGGGTYALLTGDLLLYGPGKTGEVSVHGADSKDQLASFSGNHMIVTGPLSFLHTDDELAALDRAEYLRLFAARRAAQHRRGELQKRLKELGQGAPAAEREKLGTEIAKLGREIESYPAKLAGCFKWRRPCRQSLSLILSADALFAGGVNEVAAFDRKNGSISWRTVVDGKAYGLAIAGGRLFVSTDKGVIHCFGTVESAGARAADEETR